MSGYYAVSCVAPYWHAVIFGVNDQHSHTYLYSLCFIITYYDNVLLN
jgi:hypothetical protein